MIRDIRIFSRNYMNDLAFVDGLDFPFKKWYLISIHEGDALLNKETKKALNKYGCIDSLSLKFWDVTKEAYEKIKKRYPESVLFNKNQAKKIISFIKKIHDNSIGATLIVHCRAGISRSGAVGTFACDYCKLDYDTFLKNNPFIMSNKYILQVLRDVSGIEFDKNHNGISNTMDFSNAVVVF